MKEQHIGDVLVVDGDEVRGLVTDRGLPRGIRTGNRCLPYATRLRAV